MSREIVAEIQADGKAEIGTILDLLSVRSAATPVATAFQMMDQSKNWQQIHWEQFAQAAERVGTRLADLGIGKGNRVGIMAPTSLDWEYAQMGALSVGAIVAGIDPEYPADQLSHVIENLRLSALFIQNHSVLIKVPLELRQQIGLFILFEGESQHKNEFSMADLLAEKEINVATHSPDVSPQDDALIVFSSGTTGMPKAITFTHGQVIVAIEAIVRIFDDLGSQTVFLCWLPLSNLFQRIVNFCAIKIGASSYILSDPRDLMRYVRQINPDILIGVPKIFERVYSGIVNHIEGRIWPLRVLLQWAIQIGYRCAEIRRGQGDSYDLLDKLLWKQAESIFLYRLRMVFGTRVRYLVSGSAAMPAWLLKWYDAIGLPVYEVYGISENVIPVAVNSPANRKLGTVGKPLLPNEVKLTENGEILVRGPGVFKGYQDRKEESNLHFSSDGYWHTGDLGELDTAGFLSIVGRKGDVFKTSAGKWISPVRIEERLRRIAYVEQSVVFQHELGKIVAVIVVDLEKCAQKPRTVRYSEVPFQMENMAKDKLHQILEADINTELEDLPLYQRPVYVAVTGKLFTVNGGELTVNLKVRRGIVAQRFSAYFENVVCKSDQRRAGSDRAIMSGPTIFFI